MGSQADSVPAETDLLCEHCGYTLNGLPAEGNCPECGRRIAENVGAERGLPPWERPGGRMNGFAATTWQALRYPIGFYRGLQTRQPLARSVGFARVHWAIAGALFGLAAAVHLANVTPDPTGSAELLPKRVFWLVLPLTLGAYSLLAGTTWLAARLTSFESRYRGLRFPTAVAERALHYHAPHYLPVAAVGLAVTLGYRAMVVYSAGDPPGLIPYLVALAGAVVLGAGFLFATYVAAMLNVLFANR